MTGATRVAMVTARCQPEIGGIEAHVAEVARRLVAAGVDVEVLTTTRSGDLPRAERVEGYVVRRFRAFPRERDWYLSPGLFLAVLRSRADLVHVQGVHTLVPPLAMVAAILRRRPFVLTFHSGGSSSAFRSRSRATQFRLLAPLLRHARALVGVSDFEVARFQEVVGPEHPVRLVRNGGSLPAVHAAVVPDPDLVVSSGRLEHYKGHHRVIEALPHLLESRPSARVEILGSGPYETELRALAGRLGVAERVNIRFVPPVDRAAMATALGEAGVVALLSDYEAHPVSVMEALVAGRPVLVSRTSGLTEIADRGWALGVDPGATAAQVAAALDAQLTAPVGPAPIELPTWEGCADALIDLYAEVLPRAVGPVRAGAA